MYVWIENRQQKRAEVLDVVTERWTSCPDFLCQPDADGFLDNDRTSLGWIWLIVPSETASLFPQNGKKKIQTQAKKKNAPKKRTCPPELLVPIDPGVSLPLIHADSLRCFTGLMEI